MDSKKYSGYNHNTMHKTTSANAIGSSVGSQRNTLSEGGSGHGQVHADALPPKPPPSTTTTSLGPSSNSGGSKGSYLRLGGLSRYLLEKAQSNDSGLDLSPATLQTLVHPLRTSNSSSSSLHVRSLFESPASSSEESPQVSGALIKPETSSDSLAFHPPSTPVVSRSVLSEQSHNCSETTVIEKTLTDEQTSKDVINTSKREHLEPIQENKSTKTKSTSYHNNSTTSNTSVTSKPPTGKYNRPYPNPDDVTPNDRGFQVPYAYHSQDTKGRQRFSNSNIENSDPGGAIAYSTTTEGTRSQQYSSHYQGQGHQINNSFQSSDMTHVVSSSVAPPNATPAKTSHKAAMQTPKPKSCKKKAAVPSSAKKPAGSGWKFLSEHIQNKEFLILEQLGRGGCGEVSHVMEKDTRKQFALKIVQLHGIDEAHVQECINEVEMLIDLKGTDLVVDIHTWEFNRSEKTMKILMEKGQCDLNQTIFKANKNKKPIKLIKMRYIWKSLLTIVQEIHSKGIVHADLKPANFVWVDDNLKIIDFGIASRLQSDLTSIAMANPKGTLNFISPEIIKLDDCRRSKLSPKSDIWALGCILYLMVYGRTPFEHITHPVTKMNAIVQGDIMYPPLPPHLYGSSVVDVLKSCFQTDYKKRPTAAELLRHAFMRS